MMTMQIKRDLRRLVAMSLGLFAGGGVLAAAPLSGGVVEVVSDVVHANGRTYDQVLLTGAVGSVGADAQQMTRVSFVDLSGDIVQVEFSGKGTLTISLENASGPAPAENYNQPGVLYMRGHASIAVADSDASTNLTIFSVGRTTAVNQSLFRADVRYDGVADLASLTVEANNGAAEFGSLRLGNVRFFATTGFTGVYAPDVAVQGAVTIGDIAAYDRATPVLYFGSNSQFQTLVIAGGSLFQPNQQPVLTQGFHWIDMKGGSTSSGEISPFQVVRGTLRRGGVDVTREAVFYPSASLVAAVAAVSVGTAAGSSAPVQAAVVYSAGGSVVTISLSPVDPVNVVVQPSG